MTESCTSISADDGEINLLDLLIVLVRQRRLIVVIVVLAALAGVVTAYLKPKQYSVDVMMIPSGLTASSSNLLLPLLQNTDLLAEAARRPGLAGLLKGTPLPGSGLSGVVGKDGVLTIKATARSPELAAAAANAVAATLAEQAAQYLPSTATRRRLVLERELVALRAERAQIGERPIASAELDALAKLAATDKTVELLVESTGDQNAMMQIQRGREADALRERLATAAATSPAVMSPAQRAFYLDTVMKYLDSAYREARRLETAAQPAVQVATQASAAQATVSPKTGLIIALAAVLGLMLGIVSAFIVDAIRHSRANPAQAQAWERLRQAWRG